MSYAPRTKDYLQINIKDKIWNYENKWWEGVERQKERTKERRNMSPDTKFFIVH
jgi:hypothetical protein